ncbi:MAG: flagellar biosynthesis anti-sigma factor FlgM [Butyrivibrio sp.]|uniref:flagellar biosynthesis anti-sigma factor FlgM n=1 Tax=Butyrivibrio sp. TaxID=28121 RepID=UPI0025FB5C99|nr:flagellar biosynthesis anti-sigma factor FlgM [Butyrivibrio sp.]MCR5772523.1 flagellar biosynthesis anti-sigma factor FlgM [Butyrivibrio sp.]
MRIEAYNQVQQVYNTQKVQHTGKTEKATKTDNVQISSLGKDIQVAKQAVKNAPDVREELVAPLREKVQDGTYDISSDDFADKMLAEFA